MVRLAGLTLALALGLFLILNAFYPEAPSNQDDVIVNVMVTTALEAAVPLAPYRIFRPPTVDSGPLEVKIHPMEEFDFWTREKLYDFRTERVKEYPELGRVFLELISDYEPSRLVFGQVESGKSWWGILGLNYFSSGTKSIEGPSEESRFIGNPYLLVGLAERWAYRPDPTPETLTPFYAKPTRLVWDLSERTVTCDYGLSEYFETADRLKLTRFQTEELVLVAYNAKDLGFYFMEIPQSQLKKVTLEKPSAPFLVTQFLHTGPSSGYPGGSNNMSPQMDEMDIRVTGLPATLEVNLWRYRPFDGQTPDLKVKLNLI